MECDRDRCSYVQTIDTRGARAGIDREGDRGVAILADEPAQSPTLGAGHQNTTAQGGIVAKLVCRVAVQPNNEESVLFGLFQGAGKVRDSKDRDDFEGAGGGLGQGARFARGVVPRGDNRIDPKNRATPQDCPNILGIGHLVEGHDPRRMGIGKDPWVGFRERLNLREEPLVHGRFGDTGRQGSQIKGCDVGEIARRSTGNCSANLCGGSIRG